MLNKLSQEEQKKICFEILVEFDKYCKANSLRYFISSGTLLGAVRHKGFIPWDDDIDVFMPRNDYEKLLGSFNEHNPKYRIVSYTNTDWWFMPFAKIIDTTTKVEVKPYKYDDLGVFLDVFPLDFLSGKYEDIKSAYLKIKKMREIICFKNIRFSYFSNPLKKLYLLCYKIIHCGYKNKGTNDAIVKICKQYYSDKPEYAAVLSVMYYGEKEIMDAKIFESAVDLEFEGHLFPAPIGYKEFLSNMYGDYMKLPPVEKRVGHSQIAYRKE